MTRKIYIFLMIMLSVAVMPSMTYACGSKSEKACCKKETYKESDTNSCCKKDKQHSSNKDDCGGKCGDKSCHCPVFNFTSIVPFSPELELKKHFSHTKKQNLSYKEIHFSTGYYSIWTPPNIG